MPIAIPMSKAAYHGTAKHNRAKVGNEKFSENRYFLKERNFLFALSHDESAKSKNQQMCR